MGSVQMAPVRSTHSLNSSRMGLSGQPSQLPLPQKADVQQLGYRLIFSFLILPSVMTLM